MRLFLLPVSTRRSLIYCDIRGAIPKATLPVPKDKAGSSDSSGSEKPSSPSSANPPTPGNFVETSSILDRITTKASSTWTSWEKAEGGWKKTITTYGNQVLRRIPYEEWGLKSIPRLSAKRRQLLEQIISSPSGPEKEKRKIEVIFPGAFLSPAKAPSTLLTLATERQQLHRKRMYGSFIGAPLTLPFALVPVIPNIPGFYLLFRGYSHWKALMGAQHLEFLARNDLFRLSPSKALDQLYTAGLIQKTREDSRKAPDPKDETVLQVIESVEQQAQTQTSGIAEEKVEESGEVILLKGWNGKLIAEEYKLPELEIEIERAVEQVEKKLAKPAE